jgi:hypothetical protein
MNTNDWDGKERRSGDDRRQTNRRSPERREDGVLTTREGERRRSPRRETDRENLDPEETGDK